MLKSVLFNTTADSPALNLSISVNQCIFAWKCSIIQPFIYCGLSDRHSGASAEVQKEEEKKFKEVGEAFTVLSDPKKKSRYDSGHDLDDNGMEGQSPHLCTFISGRLESDKIRTLLQTCSQALYRFDFGRCVLCEAGKCFYTASEYCCYTYTTML